MVANTGIVIALVARGLPRLIGLAAALAAAVAGPAIFALTPPPAAARHVTVALVQPGILNGPAQRVSADVQLTEGPARRADLIVWGESSVGYDLAASPRLVGRLERLSSAVGAQLLVSQDALNAAGNKSKVAVLIGPAGVQGSYVKTRLVPFGEYIPFRSALGWLSGISKAAAQNMVPGTGAHVLHATLRSGQPLTIGVLICFESAFPDMSRVDTDHGAQLIIYQTADSDLPGQLGAGPARVAQRTARGRDRPADRAGRAHRRLGGLRRPRPPARQRGAVPAGSHRRLARAAARVGQDAV